MATKNFNCWCVGPARVSRSDDMIMSNFTNGTWDMYIAPDLSQVTYESKAA